MRASSSAVRVSLSLLAAASAVAAQNSTTPIACTDGLFIVVARGTGEDEGPGASGLVADAIVERIPGSVVAPLDYPAALTDPAYGDSVQQGVAAMRDVISRYYALCPNGKTAVIGYSQGAHVSTYSYCGGRNVDLLGNDLTLGQTLSSPIVENTIAIVLFGDPSHNVDAAYNEGSAENDGLFPINEDDLQTCEDLGARIVSYCDADDVYCDQGSNEDVHSEYIQNYGDEVVDFVVAQFANAENGLPPNATASVSPTSVSPSTSATQPATSTTGSEGGEATNTEDEGDAAAWLEPGRGLLYALPLAVALAVMQAA